MKQIDFEIPPTALEILQRELNFPAWSVNQERRTPEERNKLISDTVATFTTGPLKGVTVGLNLENFTDLYYSKEKKPQEWRYWTTGNEMADTTGGGPFASKGEAEIALFDSLKKIADRKKTKKV